MKGMESAESREVEGGYSRQVESLTRQMNAFGSEQRSNGVKGMKCSSCESCYETVRCRVEAVVNTLHSLIMLEKNTESRNSNAECNTGNRILFHLTQSLRAIKRESKKLQKHLGYENRCCTFKLGTYISFPLTKRLTSAL